MLASDRSVLELGRIVYHVVANEDISLPRTSLEKNRQCRKPETLFSRSQVSGRREFADIEFPLNKAVMPLARAPRKLMGDFQIVAFDADVAVDQCVRARMSGDRQFNLGSHIYASMKRSHGILEQAPRLRGDSTASSNCKNLKVSF